MYANKYGLTDEQQAANERANGREATFVTADAQEDDGAFAIGHKTGAGAAGGKVGVTRLADVPDVDDAIAKRSRQAAMDGVLRRNQQQEDAGGNFLDGMQGKKQKTVVFAGNANEGGKIHVKYDRALDLTQQQEDSSTQMIFLKAKTTILDHVNRFLLSGCSLRGVLAWLLREFRRRKIGQMYLYRRNFIGGFYGASEKFLTPPKTTV